MDTLILVLLLAVNFGISWWNAYVCGAAWVETKAVGGWIRFVIWSAAVQSALGFSMVFLFLGATVGTATGFLPPDLMQAAISLWYILAVPLLLGSGLVITIHSWQMFWRERDLLNLATSTYNTLAMVHNVASAIDGMGAAFSNLGGFFSKLELDGDDVAAGFAILLFLIVLCSILGGVLLTATLIKRYAGTVPLPAYAGAARRYGE